jgi:hypothetical protein
MFGEMDSILQGNGLLWIIEVYGMFEVQGFLE